MKHAATFLLISTTSALLLVAINMIAGIPPNHFIGIRTTAALANLDVWKTSNYFAGVFIALIAIATLTAIEFRPKNSPYAMLTACIALLLGTWLSSQQLHWLMEIPHPSLTSIDDGDRVLINLSFILLIAISIIGFHLSEGMIKQNRFIGFRTKAALSNIGNWYTINRNAGHSLIYTSGISLLVLAVALSLGLNQPSISTLSVILLILCVLLGQHRTKLNTANPPVIS